MTEEFLIEWTFSPINYFEEPVEFRCRNETIRIDKGRAESRIPPDRYAPDHSICDQLHKELNLKFLAGQIFNHQPYTLNKPSILQGNNITVAIEGLSCRTTVGNIDLIQYDKSGNVVGDSKKERIEEQNNFIVLVSKHSSDSLLVKMMMHYDEAVRDSCKEFVHLYNIRGAIATLGGEEGSRNTLGDIISKTEWRKKWSALGKLCNDSEIKQGRHTGENKGPLRDATEEELQEARSVARFFIEHYVNYLENKDLL
ncbi:MAG: hypothetical protein M0Q44_22320 [Methylobacter sp.]|jgi:hypothetical protein|nr:hypothetical protein [Methylobacter sp.]